MAAGNVAARAWGLEDKVGWQHIGQECDLFSQLSWVLLLEGGVHYMGM